VSGCLQKSFQKVVFIEFSLVAGYQNQENYVKLPKKLKKVAIFETPISRVGSLKKVN